MKPIASFTIDHLKLLPGIYVSRKDKYIQACGSEKGRNRKKMSINKRDGLPSLF